MYIVCFIVLGIPVLIFAGFIVCALLAIPLTPILWVIDKFRNRNPTPVPETPKNPFKLDEITWALSPRQLRDRHELYVRWAHRIYLNIAIRPDTLKKPALDDAYSEAVRVDILRAYTALNRYEYALDAKSSQPQKLCQASTDALGYSRGVIRQTGLILGDWKEPRNISAKIFKGQEAKVQELCGIRDETEQHLSTALSQHKNSVFPQQIACAVLAAATQVLEAAQHKLAEHPHIRGDAARTYLHHEIQRAICGVRTILTALQEALDACEEYCRAAPEAQTAVELLEAAQYGAEERRNRFYRQIVSHRAEQLEEILATTGKAPADLPQNHEIRDRITSFCIDLLAELKPVLSEESHTRCERLIQRLCITQIRREYGYTKLLLAGEYAPLNTHELCTAMLNQYACQILLENKDDLSGSLEYLVNLVKQLRHTREEMLQTYDGYFPDMTPDSPSQKRFVTALSYELLVSDTEMYAAYDECQRMLERDKRSRLQPDSEEYHYWMLQNPSWFYHSLYKDDFFVPWHKVWEEPDCPRPDYLKV